MAISQRLKDIKAKIARTQILRDKGTGDGLKKDTPAVPNDAWSRQMPAWIQLNDVRGGTRSMREKSTTYLPQMPLEEDADYQGRVNQTEFFNMFDRTIRGLAGMVFRKDPTISEETPKEIHDDFWPNVTNSGKDGPTFLKDLFKDGWELGHALILTDYPQAPINIDGTPLTLAQEQELGLRPYWVKIRADQVVSYRTENIHGQTVLSQLVVKEHTHEASGEFLDAPVDRWRVWKRVLMIDEDTGKERPVILWEVWSKNDVGDVIKGNEGQLRNQVEIPVSVCMIGDEEALIESRPPLEDLSYTNIAHWNVLSDHRYSLHKASLPIFVTIGMDDDQEEGDNSEIEISVNRGLSGPIGSSAMYVEHSGQALSASDKEQEVLERRAGLQGLSMLVGEKRAAETAESKRISKSEADSTLSSSARSLQNAVNKALEFTLRYYGIDVETAEWGIIINQEFDDFVYPPGMVTALSALESSNQISLETLWNMLVTGQILPADFDGDDEAKRLTLDGIRVTASADEAKAAAGDGLDDEGDEEEEEEKVMLVTTAGADEGDEA